MSSPPDNQQWQLSRSSDKHGHQTSNQLSLKRLTFFSFAEMNCIMTKCARKNILLLPFILWWMQQKKIEVVVLQCTFDVDLIKHMTKTYKSTRSRRWKCHIATSIDLILHVIEFSSHHDFTLHTYFDHWLLSCVDKRP